MLTLLPLSGIQDVFKRRNSTTMEQFTDRRGSISVYDTYSLPTSKADMRRFSSYEQLAPFFQQILSHENGKMTPAPAPVPAPAPLSPSTTTGSISPTIPSPLVRSRRGSVSRFTSALTGSFRRQKSALKSKPVSESDSDVSCDDLDAKLAEIKEKLAQFKTEDIDMSQRVEDLSSSVEELYTSTPEWCLPRGDSHQDQLYYQWREHKIGQMHRSNSWQNYRPSLSASGLHSISETTSEIDDNEQEEQQEEEVLIRTEVRLRRSTPVQRSRPSSYASISEEPQPSTAATATTMTSSSFVNDDANTKSYCLLNNTIATKPRSRAHSMSQLPHVIRNDLSHRTEAALSKRNSVISIMSDSVLITHRHLPAMQSLLKQHEF